MMDRETLIQELICVKQYGNLNSESQDVIDEAIDMMREDALEERAVKMAGQIQVLFDGIRSEYYRAIRIRETAEKTRTIPVEAQVLTKTELRQMSGPVLVWTEYSTGVIVPEEFMGAEMRKMDGVDEEQEMAMFGNGMDYMEDYNKTYRLWTAKPTQEQAEAILWDKEEGQQNDG